MGAGVMSVGDGGRRQRAKGYGRWEGQRERGRGTGDGRGAGDGKRNGNSSRRMSKIEADPGRGFEHAAEAPPQASTAPAAPHQRAPQ